MYRNIIFDLGGVVVDFHPRSFLVDHFMNERVEKQIYDITFGSQEWLALDAGLLTRQQANAIMRQKAAAIGRSFEVDVVLHDWYDMLKTKEDTVQLLNRLKKHGYRLFYLSNISFDVLEFLRDRKFWAYFEGGIASCQIQMTKPDLRIYQVLLRQYGLRPEECIFLDDNRNNAVAATQCGITGLHFRGMKPAVQQMLKLGIALDKRTPPIAPPRQ